MEQVTSLVMGHIVTIMIAVVGLTVASIMAGRIIGKSDKRKRRVAASLTFYGGMILFALLFLPQLLAARG